MVAFVFADEGEAKTLFKKVTNRKADTGAITPRNELCEVLTMIPRESEIVRNEEEVCQRWQDRQINDFWTNSGFFSPCCTYGL